MFIINGFIPFEYRFSSILIEAKYFLRIEKKGQNDSMKKGLMNIY